MGAMSLSRTGNLLGALSLAIADDVLDAVRAETDSSGASAAAALALLGHAPGLTIKQLGQVLRLSHPGAVRLVDRLARDALVTRERSAQDGRAVTLALTGAGRAAAERILASRRGVLEAALGAFSATECRTFEALAEKLLRAALDDGLHAARVCRLCDPDDCRGCPVESEIASRAG